MDNQNKSTCTLILKKIYTLIALFIYISMFIFVISNVPVDSYLTVSIIFLCIAGVL